MLDATSFEDGIIAILETAQPAPLNDDRNEQPYMPIWQESGGAR